MLTPIKLRRLQKGMRQIQLASRARIARARLSEIECGYVEPRPEEVARIAKALNVPVESLTPAAAREHRLSELCRDEMRLHLDRIEREHRDGGGDGSDAAE